MFNTRTCSQSTLAKLSAEGNWDEVFYCLQIDVNSTIELGSLKKLTTSEAADDLWLDAHKATTNTLEVILAIILFVDQIFFIALVCYLLMFSFKFLRFHGLEKICKFRPRSINAYTKSIVKNELGTVENNA